MNSVIPTAHAEWSPYGQVERIIENDKENVCAPAQLLYAAQLLEQGCGDVNGMPHCISASPGHVVIAVVAENGKQLHSHIRCFPLLLFVGWGSGMISFSPKPPTPLNSSTFTYIAKVAASGWNDRTLGDLVNRLARAVAHQGLMTDIAVRVGRGATPAILLAAREDPDEMGLLVISLPPPLPRALVSTATAKTEA